MLWGHPQAYNVIVEIIEVQNLVWPVEIALTDKKSKIDAKLPNPLVEVAIRGQSYYTDSKEATSSCAFNKTFYFQHLMLDSSEFQRSTVEIRVLNQGFFKQELIGLYTGSFEKIYSLPNHRLLKTLVPITIPERPSIPLGYIRLSIYILGENDLVAPEDSFGCDDSFGNIVSISNQYIQSTELAITYYHLNFNIHLARDVLLPDYADLSHQEADGYLPSPFVRIVVLDNALETAIIRSSPSPVWNETLKFPVGIPCLDDRIVLELWDAQGGGDGPRLVAQTKLSLQDILQSELGPTWLHFYGQTTGLRGSAIDIKSIAISSMNSQSNGQVNTTQIIPVTIKSSTFGVLGMFDTKHVASYPCVAYLGRLLVSASLSRIPNPTPIKNFCQPAELPKVDPYLLWGDIYEISGLGLPSEVYIELSIGSWTYWVIPDPSNKISDSFPLTPNLGRIPDQIFAMPDIDMSADLLIRVFTKDESQDRPLFHSYIRISTNEMLRYSSDRPRWYPLLSAAHYGIMVGQDIPYDEAAALSHIKHYGMILGSFILRKSDQDNQFEHFVPSSSKIKRPKRIQYNLCRWICRAYIFQAIRLPVVESTLPDSLVMVTLGGGTVLTEVIPKTVNPDWHEALVFDAALPEDLSIAQWLNIAVLHEDIVLGSVAISPLYIGFMKKSRPEWFILQTPRTPECKARILCTFELVKIGDINSNILYSSLSNIDFNSTFGSNLERSSNVQQTDKLNNWFIPDVTPTYVPCDIHLFLIGIRLRNQSDSVNSIFSLSSSAKPIIQFEFGRDPEKPENRLWIQQATEPIQGDSGKYNYLKNFCLKCHIPASPIYQTYLEIRVLEPVNVFGTKCREFGTAYLHLNQHLPWIEEYHQRSLKTEFQYLPPLMSTKKWLNSGKKFLSKYYKGPWKFWKNKVSESPSLSPKMNLSGSSSSKLSYRSSLISLPTGEIVNNVGLCDDFNDISFGNEEYDELGNSYYNRQGDNENNIKLPLNNDEKSEFDDFFDIFYEQSSTIPADNSQLIKDKTLLLSTDNKFEIGLPNLIQDFFFSNDGNNVKYGKESIQENDINTSELNKELSPINFLKSNELYNNYYNLTEEESFANDPALNIPIHDLEALNSCISSMESYIKPIIDDKSTENYYMLSENIRDKTNKYYNISKNINWGIRSQLYDTNVKKMLNNEKMNLDWFLKYELYEDFGEIDTNELLLEMEDDDNNDCQDELNHEYETELDMDELPYDSIPIISANRVGEAEVVGFLKIYCKILSRYSINRNINYKISDENDNMNIQNKGEDQLIAKTPVPKLLNLSSREIKENQIRELRKSSINMNIADGNVNNYMDIGNMNNRSFSSSNYSLVSSSSSSSFMTKLHNRRFSLSSFEGDVLSNTSDSSYVKDGYYYDPLLEKLKRQIADISRLKVRIYVLTGHGFVPPKVNTRNALLALSGTGGCSSDNEANWYINVKTGPNSTSSLDISNAGNSGYNIRNSSNIDSNNNNNNRNNIGNVITCFKGGIFEINDAESISKGFSPDFYKSYELDAILPVNALLTISIMNKSSNISTFYGRTYIDIEDRFFHPLYQKTLNSDTLLPIEIRQLYSQNDDLVSNITQGSVGSLRCWIHVLPPEIAILRPLYPLNPPTAEICQVRVVIYKLKNIPISKLVNNSGMTGLIKFGEPSISLMVKGLMSPNSNTVIEQDTDTHWNSSDGTAVFNWRFVFNVPVPCHFPILRLQVWNRGLLVFGDALSECSLDLSSYLMRSRKLNSKININRTLINMCHPARPNEKRGEMEIEISILPLSLAESMPVGIGREEPNRDPYLPDVTDHRNYITTSAFGKGFFTATSNVKWGAKLLTWLITAVVIITILSLLIKLFK
ncbi:hypothetical protein FG379_001665 [Cryptosporidium bovis]|uniref:uncharacterized protein n=1 Tax=Cryptosporidium bovis TaxID=310047 RepID=UPI00351A47E7|nr:hypothetical protein FG379_001665 [Cryptosporidium bovis]